MDTRLTIRYLRGADDGETSAVATRSIRHVNEIDRLRAPISSQFRCHLTRRMSTRSRVQARTGSWRTSAAFEAYEAKFRYPPSILLDQRHYGLWLVPIFVVNSDVAAMHAQIPVALDPVRRNVRHRDQRDRPLVGVAPEIYGEPAVRQPRGERASSSLCARTISESCANASG